ncbi:tegument protein VP22 [Canid alphaherpesvirus 1]|uniref:Tegument protein VP22 n=1 Tax=Canid alphaherpesvirus 1 TaxID=170325 RepID=A0A172DSJ7_9ALPH|nr:tegument protein VP22 [Canid alphaherpesvirus 1]ALL25967.1 tegument protein VP22 [Canid alphaherpesvirus 1]AQX83324.1 tegument protein VP22 [Canid alphaherpesvirus 1]QQL08466.1 tegument protein VP22 [Canid alphaherpesvirus 1]QQL08540.1 tegument protein VP22 [Canid alphaherpesvirus 1]
MASRRISSYEDEPIYATIKRQNGVRRKSSQRIERENPIYERTIPTFEYKNVYDQVCDDDDEDHIYELCENQYAQLTISQPKSRPKPPTPAEDPKPRIPVVSYHPSQQKHVYGAIKKKDEKLDTPPKSTRTEPGSGVISSSKPISFSNTPKTPKSPWYGATHLYNKNVFCEAVRRCASKHAIEAASSIWDLNPPQSNEELEKFLTKAVIRITISEGLGILKTANTPFSCGQKTADDVKFKSHSSRRSKSQSRSRHSRGDFDDSSD